MDRSRVRLLNRAGYVGPVGLYRNSDPHGYVGSAQWRDRCAQPEHPDCPQLFVAVKDHRCQLPDVRTRCFDTSFDQQYHGDGAGRRCVRHTERIPGGASTAVPFEYPTHGSANRAGILDPNDRLGNCRGQLRKRPHRSGSDTRLSFASRGYSHLQSNDHRGRAIEHHDGHDRRQHPYGPLLYHRGGNRPRYRHGKRFWVADQCRNSARGPAV